MECKDLRALDLADGGGICHQDVAAAERALSAFRNMADEPTAARSEQAVMEIALVHAASVPVRSVRSRSLRGALGRALSVCLLFRVCRADSDFSPIQR